ncbi:Electron transfer flavoprotein alpha/beta-subunit [Chlorobium limicola DSM 245]|uniref:Electron transfer flavoprotein alpha/beta-subunit n=1 Tax=Chlorobium limicola (strain DSM 245 / NBRC 103803 / 6330) TaxID=290315 RepID=B3EFD6_CHLL2|nr:electron transfer flavoprotein subunit beta/FixA family protein [Chlorobium limicola]ACD89419.1 Electron transfer flavoprotein alpha/beta-subunit [Chlorobium limicola DSM 245]
MLKLIAVCICQVPDLLAAVAVVEGSLDLSRVAWVMNPYDEYALEEALRLKERFPGSAVVALAAAPEAGKELLQKALAMGADRAVEVRSSPLQDSFQTAWVLAEAIRNICGQELPDLVLCGRESLDLQNASVPAMLAGMLGMPFAGPVTALRADGERLEMEREGDGGLEILEASYPLVVSAEKGLNIPRKTGIRQVMEARKKPLEIMQVSVLPDPLVRLAGAEPVSRKKVCRFADTPAELVGLLHRGGFFNSAQE